MTPLTFILRRAVSQWTRLLTLCLGMILAVTLLAASPALISTIIDFTLRRHLTNGPPSKTDVRLTSRLDLEEQQLSALDAERRDEIEARLGSYAEHIIVGGALVPFNPWRNETLIREERVYLRFYDSAENLRPRLELIAGEWPDHWTVSADYAPVLISPPMAEAYGLSVGSELPLSSGRSLDTPSFTATVVGIVQPHDPQADYWFDIHSPFRAATNDQRYRAEYSMLMPPSAVVEVGKLHFADLDLTLHWHVLVEKDRLTQENIVPLASIIEQWRNDALNRPDLTLFSELDEQLIQFRAQAAVIRSPLFFIILIVGLLSLFYIVFVNTLSLAQTESEFATLISRGANRRQIIRWQGVETFGLAFIAILGGMLLAWAGMQLIARSGPLGSIYAPEWSLRFTYWVWLGALLGGITAAVVSFLPLPVTLRSSIVTHLQGRIRQQETQPWWQRYYADVMLLAVGGILISRLPIYGNLLGDSTNGGDEGVDWLLLLAPALLLFGTATLFLRAFPPLLQLLARLSGRNRGLSLVLVLWQVARQPRHVSRLLLLLTMTTALGLFSTSLNATLTLNETARARFLAVGAERYAFQSAIAGTPAETVEKQTQMWRSNGAIGSGLGDGGGRFELLAVEPVTFNEIAEYRSDFASQPLDSLLTALDAQVSEQFLNPHLLELPGRHSEIELYFWLRDEDAEAVPGFSFDAKLLAATNDRLTVTLTASGAREENKWTRFSADIPQLTAEQYPLSLLSLWMRAGQPVFVFPDAAPAIDKLSVIDESGKITLVTGFETDEGAEWQTTPNGPLTIQFETQGETESQLSGAVETGNADRDPVEGESVLAMLLFFQELAAGLPYGIHSWANASEEPIPALVTPRFLEASGAEVGDVVLTRIAAGSSTWVPTSIKISAVINYFPSLSSFSSFSSKEAGKDEQGGGSIVISREPLLLYLNTLSHREVDTNEIVFSESTTDVNLFNQALAVWEYDQIIADLKSTPLVLGLRTVTSLGYFLSAVLSLAGFGTYFFLNTRRHSGSYAVLRALGMSIRQLYATLLIEQTILVVTGLSVGTLLGLLLARMTLQNLPFRTGEIGALPPFQLVIRWQSVTAVLLTLIVAFGITLGLVALALWRADIHRTLRVGEE